MYYVLRARYRITDSSWAHWVEGTALAKQAVKRRMPTSYVVGLRKKTLGCYEGGMMNPFARATRTFAHSYTPKFSTKRWHGV
jgi:hypothetical protein